MNEFIVNIGSNKDRISIAAPISMIKIKDELWFFLRESNVLVSYNLKTKQASYCGGIPWEESYATFLYTNMIYFEDKLYLIPYHAKTAGLPYYDLKQKAYGILEIPMMTETYTAATVYGRTMFICALYKPEILKINLDSGITEKIHIQDDNGMIDSGGNNVCFVNQVVICDGSLYVPFGEQNAFLKLNCSTNHYDIISLGNNTCGYSGCAYDGENIWFAPRKADADLIRYQKGKIDKIKLVSTDIEVPRNCIYASSGKIVLFSNAKKSLCDDKNVIIYDSALAGIVDGNNHYYFDVNTGELQIYIDEKLEDKIKFDISVEWMGINQRMLDGNAIEDINCTLERMVKIADDIRENVHSPHMTGKTNGENIYQYLTLNKNE